jgi:hypothetical protein
MTESSNLGKADVGNLLTIELLSCGDGCIRVRLGQWVTVAV